MQVRTEFGVVEVPDPKPPLQVVATHGRFPLVRTTQAGVMLTECSLKVKFGPSPCSGLRLLFSGFTAATDGTGEQPLLNDITYVTAIERISPNKIVMGSVSGTQVLLVSSGVGLIMTTPISFTMNAAEEAWIQIEARFVANGNYPVCGGGNTVPPAVSYRSTVLATGQVGTLTASWVGTSRTSSPNTVCPTAVLGIPKTPFPAVAIIGDSIASHVDDSPTGDAAGNHGWIPRGLYIGGPNGTAIPFVNMAVQGEKVQTIQDGGAAMRLSILQYVSHVIFEEGVNDIQGGGPGLATMKTRYTNAWAAVKAWNVKLYQTMITPRTTSTDSWATAANQTFVAGHEPGGLRDQLNDWFLTQVGITIDGTINPNAWCEDGSSNKWISNGTANWGTDDGIHPSAMTHALMAQAIAPISSLWTVNAMGRPE